jgi:superfamily II DNA/RNA helicase
MLDMGFEREMDQCLSLIKKKVPDSFVADPLNFHSEKIRVNFVSATLSAKVETLGAKLMSSYETVGFGNDN